MDERLIEKRDDGVIHVVQPGENLESIAFRQGHSSAFIWNHEKNRKLRSIRDDPSVLLPGDEVFIPPVRPKHECVATGACHVFRRKGVPSVLRFRALLRGHPLSGHPYIVEANGLAIPGTTDAEGRLECFIRPDTSRATVHIGTEPFRLSYVLNFCALAPVTEGSGLLARLVNLGYCACGESEKYIQPALRCFQSAHGLEPTGEPDHETVRVLTAVHGS